MNLLLALVALNAIAAGFFFGMLRLYYEGSLSVGLTHRATMASWLFTTLFGASFANLLWLLLGR